MTLEKTAKVVVNTAKVLTSIASLGGALLDPTPNTQDKINDQAAYVIERQLEEAKRQEKEKEQSKKSGGWFNSD